MKMRLRLPLVAFFVASASWLALAQDRPLPHAETFFARTRDNLTRSARVQDQYAYKERRTQLHMNPFGRLGTGGTLLFEVTPFPDGAGFNRRLLERDGKAVVNGEVERVTRRRGRDRAQSSSAIQDTMAVLDFAIDRRDHVAGRPTIVIRFTPKPGAKPRTREGRLASAFTGHVWVDEEAHQVLRVEATAIDSISYGYGLVARLGEGTNVTLVRQRVTDDVWMPTRIHLQGEGRALLFRKLNVDFSVDWFDYKKLPTPNSQLPSQ
jgi:hypothetical protein